MEQLANRLQKIQEFATPTHGGFYLTNFHRSNSYSGVMLYRLHFRRNGASKPTSFDVAIQYAGNYIVDYKDPDQDITRIEFADYESVMDYLTAK